MLDHEPTGMISYEVTVNGNRPLRRLLLLRQVVAITVTDVNEAPIGGRSGRRL